MFGPDGTVMQPSEVLYKKNVLVLRDLVGNVRICLAQRVVHVPNNLVQHGFGVFGAIQKVIDVGANDVADTVEYVRHGSPLMLGKQVDR